MAARKRMSPESKALEQRKAKMHAEIRKLHPKAEVIFSIFGNELTGAVPDGPAYRDTLPDTDPVEAAYSTDAR